jgi:hypothetical protein
MNRTGKRRLLKLAAMLMADAKNKKGIQFDIGTVGRSTGEPFKVKQVVPLDCGTSACAMGLAALSGEFKKAGLSYKIQNDFLSQNQIWTRWNGRTVDYDKAAMKLFGVTKEQADYLFSPWTYPLNKRTGAVGEYEVIRRIKCIVAGKKVEQVSTAW